MAAVLIDLTRMCDSPAGGFPTSWVEHAACRLDGAPDMFADQWGVGRDGRRRRSAALATCRACPVRRDCGQAALTEIEAGLGLYGVRCGIEFTDVTPSRQRRDVDRLRLVVARLTDSARTPASSPALPLATSA